MERKYIDSNLIARFENKINKTEYCWIWTASKTDQNYGVIWLNGKYVRSHRVSYMIYKGDLDPSLVIDHLCKNTLCVNPQHLDQVTQAENIKRGVAGKVNNAQRNKTHCPSGHQYSSVTKNGYRQCRVCRTRQQKEYRRRKLDNNKKSG